MNAVLKEVHFKQGDFVKKGDLLFTLDARPFQASLAQAQANLARDKAQADLTIVQAERYKKLYDEGISPKEQYDQMQANAAAQQGSVHADEAAVESAKLQLQYCEIYSPVDGRTGSFAGLSRKLGERERCSGAGRDQPDCSAVRGFFRAGTVSRRDQEIYGRQAAFKLKPRLMEIPRPKSGYLTFVDNTVDNTTGTIKLKGYVCKRGPSSLAGAVLDRVASFVGRRKRYGGSDASGADGTKRRFRVRGQTRSNCRIASGESGADAGSGIGNCERN